MKKQVLISIHLDDVVFDVLNTTHHVGNAVLAADERSYEVASQMMASLDDEDLMMLRRSIQDAASRIKTEFGEYLTETSTSACNRLQEEILKENGGTITYTFSMPGNFNSAAVDALQAGIHSYIVSSTVADWFTVTNASGAEGWRAKMATNLENAKRALYKRSRPSLPSHYTSSTPSGSASTNSDPCEG